MSKSQKIIIAESSEIIRKGLINIINNTELDIHIINTHSLAGIYNHINKYYIDIILINPTLLLNNTDFFNELLSKSKETKWLGIISTFFDKEILLLFDNLIYINDNSEIVKEKINKLLTQKKTNKTSIRNILSKREIDVLKLLVSGNSNKKIADKLFISTYTVMTHRKNISQKTGIKSVAGLTIYAVINKIIKLDSYAKYLAVFFNISLKYRNKYYKIPFFRYCPYYLLIIFLPFELIYTDRNQFL